MAKYYPKPFGDAKELTNSVKEWAEHVGKATIQLSDDYERMLGSLQFYEGNMRALLFYLGGEVIIPKEIVDEYNANVANEDRKVNVKASPQEDGSFRIWTILESEDEPESES